MRLYHPRLREARPIGDLQLHRRMLRRQRHRLPLPPGGARVDRREVRPDPTVPRRFPSTAPVRFENLTDQPINCVVPTPGASPAERENRSPRWDTWRNHRIWHDERKRRRT